MYWENMICIDKNSYKSFAGIGSRETPSNILNVMQEISKFLTTKHGFVLNSGGADGADHAFEIGASSSKKIFLPWDGFNGKHVDNDEYIIPPYNEEYIKKYHPAFNRLSEKGRLLMSRNTYQVLGENLLTPVNFVVCWTKDGKASGGTGQAIRIAKSQGIPVFNLKTDMQAFKNLTEWL